MEIAQTKQMGCAVAKQFKFPTLANVIELAECHGADVSAIELARMHRRGEFASVGSKAWHQRMSAAMDAVCDGHGQPVTKLHGLRMLDPKIMERYPLASADSTNMGRNIGLDVAWTGRNAPADLAVRGFVMAERIDATVGAERWVKSPQEDFFELEVV